MNNFNFDALPVDKTIINFLKQQQGIIIDKYSSKGGNSELFFGSNKITTKRVALKFYYTDDGEECHEEVRILSKLRHSNILEVYDAKIISKDYAYFLTPEISGGDLDEFIQENNIEVYKSIHIVKGILKGLTALHSKPNRLMHRDLKACNILVDKILNSFIADFGSIRIAPPSETSIKATKHSILYRPPEAFSHEVYYFNSDIYQVGIILYQLLGGYFPYKDIAWLNERMKEKYASFRVDYEKSRYFDEILEKKICSGRLLLYDSLPPFICRNLRSIISRATNIDLSRRYQNTSEFMRDIHVFMLDSVNWFVTAEGFVATMKDGTKFRVANCGRKALLQKKCIKGWRLSNDFRGSLKEICEQINSVK
jgi:serine/threonine protein kinase